MPARPVERTPPAHNYAGLTIFLNQNVIDGQPTVLCTINGDLSGPLGSAIDTWNAYLSSLQFGEDGGEAPLVQYHPPQGANCDDVDGVVDVDVEVVTGSDCRDSRGNLAPNARACYRSGMSRTSPRRLFTTRNGSQQHSTIIYQAGVVRVSTLVHELGHVLGLADYNVIPGVDGNQGCDLIHHGNPTIADLTRRAPDIDPLDNQFSLMRNSPTSPCRADSVITGRDLRDFYEAYHVGAITNVQLALADGQSSIARNRPFVLEWGSAGVREAGHNASHVVVFGKNDDETTWRLIGSLPIRNGQGVAHRRIMLTDTIYGSTTSYPTGGGFADTYKVVGVTRGDIRRQRSFDKTVALVGRVTPGPADPDPTGGPPQPTNVDAEGSGTAITLSWSAVAGATGYVVRLGESGAGTPATGLNHSFPGLNVNTPYTLSVRAVRSGAMSGWASVTTSLTTHTEGDPAFVVGVAASFPNHFGVLSASASPRYCFTGSTVPVSWQAGTVTRLGQNWTLSVKVKDPVTGDRGTDYTGGQTSATASCGDTPGRRMITVEAKWTPPSGSTADPEDEDIQLPINVHATPTTALDLSNVSVSQADGFTLSDGTGDQAGRLVVDCSQGDTSEVRWMVEHGVLPVGVWVTPMNIWMPEDDWVAGFGASPVTIRCPSGGATDQTLGVIALGADGGGEEAMSGSIARPLAQPAAVTLGSTQPTSATLTWSAPGAGGARGGAAGAAGASGASDLRYGVWRSRGTVGETTATTYEFENLTPYQTYGLVVWTENQAGDRSPDVRVPVTLPGRANELRTRAPSTVTVRRVTTNSATLVWSGVSGATGYIVWRSHGREINLPAAERSYTFRGLTRGRDYSLLVRATGPAGVSPWARKAINTSRFRPSAPTGLRATRTPTSARLYWNAVPGAVGYELWRSKGEREWTRAANHPFDDLMPYETYNLYVRTRNASGDVSRWAILGVTLPGRPGVARTGPPTGLTTSGLTSTSVTLNWNAGTAVSEYGVWRSNGSTVQLDSGTRRHTFENLTPGTRYALMVWAEGHGGVSIWKRRFITTPARVTALVRPDPPSNLRATATTTSLRLTWNAAPGATSYEVKRGSSGTVRTVSSGRRYYRFPGLQANMPYTLYVRTVKGASKSLWSPPLSARTNEIPRPTVLPPEATHDSLKLIWRSVSEATSYDVKLGAGGTIRNTTRTEYEFPSLPSNWSRTLFVRARNAGGVSLWNSKTGTTTPPAPTGLHADATTTTLTLTWTADRVASRYDVGIDEPVVIADTGKTKYEFPDLTPNTQYTLYVWAKTGAGSSPWAKYPAKTAAFEGRIRARTTSDGRVEFCFQLRSQISSGGCIKPTDRFVTPSTMPVGRVISSSPIAATINGERRTIGKISVTRPAGANYIDVCFTPHGGAEVCPTLNNFRWAKWAVGRWIPTNMVLFHLPSGASGAAGASESPGATMEAADPDEPDSDGSDGGLMGSGP